MKVLFIDKKTKQHKQTLNLLNFYLGEVDICYDGIEAIEQYIEKFDNNNCYDVVFINYDSNTLNGYDISDKILFHNMYQKIIILTEKSNLHFMKRLLLKGVTNFLVYPIEETQFIELAKINNFFNNECKVIYKKSTVKKNLPKSFNKVSENYFNDVLTGLPNRKKLEQDLTCDSLPIIILIDIDKLSVINEIYGLEFGNQVILEVSKFLKKYAFDHSFTLYKVTGDGFVLADCVTILDIFKYQNDLIELFEEIRNFTVFYKNENISIDITAGVSMVQGQSLEKADIALNYAKKTKKEYIVYSNMLDDTAKKHSDLQWKQKLKTSIDTNNIISVYQAIVDKDKNILKYETLMRVRAQNGELITPYFFLDIAVDTKQYTILSSIIIKKALSDAIYSDKDISINVSYTDIINHQFISEIESFIINNNLGNKIIFEIVESEYIEDYKLLANFISRFRVLGIRFAIDDFGSGFSNFEYILKIKPEYIKIDGSLISRIHNDKKAYILVESIINLAKKLNIKTICEFVSTKEIFELLKNLNVDQYQGYYLHKPQEINFKN